MNINEKNTDEAKKIIKLEIKFFEELIDDLNSNDEAIRVNALLTSWCLHRYLNEGLIKDVMNALEKFSTTNH